MVVSAQETRSRASGFAGRSAEQGGQSGSADSATTSLLVSLCLYLALSLLTVSTFLADTGDYADSIVARFQGRYYDFWEFGHVLWRPLGWAITRAIGTLVPGWMSGTTTAHYHAVLVLMAVSWLAGFLTLYLFHRSAMCITGNFWRASIATAGFATAQAFLNFVQAGTAYIPGLAMLMLAIFLLVKSDDDAGRADRPCAWAGVALAGSLLFWFPYVLVVPAVVLMPVLLRRSLRGAVITAGGCAIASGVVYLAVIAALGLHRPGDILAWERAASHGIQIGGVSRAVFGFARSFVNMGKDGMLFKRYLLHDPYSPVSASDLARAVLLKLGLFYVFLTSVVASFIIVKRWNDLAVLAIAGTPVLLFAARWQGGDMERYLPLYPFLFLAVAISLTLPRPRFQRWVIGVFLVTMALVNISALSRRANRLQEEEVAHRAAEIPPALLTDAGVMYVTHNGDEFFNFARSFPFAPLNRRASLHIHAVVEAGHHDLPMWRATFAKVVLAAWDRQGNVWVSRRVFSPAPKPAWNWVEHDDPRVSWTDLSPFFAGMQYEPCVGGDDGFCLLPPSTFNREFLVRTLRAANQGLAPSAYLPARW